MQSSPVCVGNCERRCTDLWMLPNDRENIMPRFGRREGFSEAWLLRVISLAKTWRRTIFDKMITVTALLFWN